MKNQKYLYVGSYIVTYDIENPNQIKNLILVERDNPYIDFNIYFNGIDRVFIQGSLVPTFEAKNNIVFMNNSALAKHYEKSYKLTRKRK